MTYLLDETAARLRARHEAALPTLHPELRKRVLRVVERLGGRMLVWEGYRSHERQRVAYAKGYSNAGPGDSPHNCEDAGVPCSRAADLVLHPIKVLVMPSLADPRYPNLWETKTAEAQQAWADLDNAALLEGLRRVNIGRPNARRPDLPHVELPDWRSERWILPGGPP